MPMPSLSYTGYEELSELSEAELKRCTKSSLPLFIPWHPNKTIPLGTFFFSNRTTDPWATNSPFLTTSLAQTSIFVERDYGSQSEFKSISTSRSTQTNDHLELGLGIGAGLPFIASVSVKGDYCKDVQENKDNNKTSVNFSTRSGSVAFTKQPQLTSEAIIEVKYNGGLPAFHEKYGDYYLAAYRLGGETGIMVSGSHSDKRTLDRFGITVTVEVLFIEESVTYTQDNVHTEALNTLKIIGYDTLGHTKYNSMAEDQAPLKSEAKKQAQDYCDKAKTLDLRVADKLDALYIHDGDQIDTAMCRKLVEAGLVVELMLLPAITLRQVQAWVLEDNII